MAVEQAVHLPPIGDAEVDLADGGLGSWGLLQPCGPERGSSLDGSPSFFSPSGPLPLGRLSVRAGQGPAQPGEASPLTRPAGMRQAVSPFHLLPPSLMSGDRRSSRPPRGRRSPLGAADLLRSESLNRHRSRLALLSVAATSCGPGLAASARIAASVAGDQPPPVLR
jgi:hypothetical protein